MTMVTSNPLPQTTLAPRAQLFALALAALIAPASTSFCAGGTVLFGTDYLTDGDADDFVGLPHLRQ